MDDTRLHLTSVDLVPLLLILIALLPGVSGNLPNL